MLSPSLSVPIALTVFAVVVVACFQTLDPRRAVTLCLLGGTMFLPVFESAYHVPILTTKAAFVPAVVLAASLLFDSQRWRRQRPSLLDLPIAIICLVPCTTSLSNDLGAYDAAYSAFSATMTWGAPYLLGRVYLGHRKATEGFANTLVVAALVYVPLCAWEIRMSPSLHQNVFGFSQGHNWTDNVRFGGYRPAVFMDHGLMLGMFMASGTLVALWMWRTGARRSLWGVSFGWYCAVLAGTMLLTKSVGAILLLFGGFAVLEMTRRFRTAAFILVLLTAPAAYCTTRVAGWWSGQALVAFAADTINSERAGSLAFRLANEDILIDKARAKPWLGWGGWGRSSVKDEEGRTISVTDALWIIVFGTQGMVGLIALGLFLAIPAALLRRFPARDWTHPALAGTAALAVSCLLWAVDDLFNAMMTPVIPAICGAMASLYLSTGHRTQRRVLRPRWHGPGQLRMSDDRQPRE